MKGSIAAPPAAPLPPEPELPVTIDYLAKDYSSFRQALLDFIPTRLPAWTERSEADLGMMLLELFAYTGDNFSYMQDRVANEAYLGTATQRRSVALISQLIGYQMDEGASAYTWLQFQVSEVQNVTREFKVSNQPKSDTELLVVFEPLARRRASIHDTIGCRCSPGGTPAAACRRTRSARLSRAVFPISKRATTC